MAFRGTVVGSVLLVLMTMLWSRSMAQSGCINTLIGMAPCLNYVTGRSSTPTSSCCSSLANVIKSQPQCLCSALNGGGVAALGITINSTLALALPGECNVKTPPVSLCNGANGPVVSPVGSPGNSPSVSGCVSKKKKKTNAATGSKTTQENGATPSGGSIITTPFLLVAILVSMASYV